MGKKFENCEDFCDFAPVFQCDEEQRPLTKKEWNKHRTERRKVRYNEDEDYKQKVLTYHNIWNQAKYWNDPIYREKRLASQRKYRKSKKYIERFSK